MIFNLTFSKVSAGTTTISFFDDGSSCFYANDSSQTLNDLPASSYYFDGSVTFQPLGVGEAGREILSLSVYPNPFTGRATARWYAPFTGTATLVIYNLLGEQVELVEKRIEQPGAQEFGIPPGRLSPGIYTVRILLRGSGRVLMGTTKAVCCE